MDHVCVCVIVCNLAPLDRGPVWGSVMRWITCAFV